MGKSTEKTDTCIFFQIFYLLKIQILMYCICTIIKNKCYLCTVMNVMIAE